MGTMAMVVHRQPPRKTDEEKEGWKGEEEGKGEVENCGGRRGLGSGKKGRLRGEEGWLARKRPPTKVAA